MSKKYQNFFFIFGIVVLAIMVTQLDFNDVWNGLQRAGYWFFAVVALWLGLYAINTLAWYIIIRQGGKGNEKSPFSFVWLYKITVSGFALNYATPGGLMGGEAYRIMALAPKIGTERASSSVILYVMTHIFSHFWFWLISAILFILTHDVTLTTGIIVLLTALFCLLGIWFFMKGYKKGMAVRLAQWLSHIPFIGKWAQSMIDNNKEKLENIDRQIAALHKQNPATFVSAVLLELGCRFISSLEIMFVLLVLSPHVDFFSCVIILAFTSLFANLLFFIPLQLGGREGGFMLSASGLAMAASSGIFVALIIRLRELIWTAIGLLLIKAERSRQTDKTNKKSNGIAI